MVNNYRRGYTRAPSHSGRCSFDVLSYIYQRGAMSNILTQPDVGTTCMSIKVPSLIVDKKATSAHSAIQHPYREPSPLLRQPYCPATCRFN